MTLHQTLRAAPAKTNDLLAQLADTSNAAVKTREKLLAELRVELQSYTDLESEHLIPVLRKHEETKGLVAEAIKGTKALRSKLAELEAAPKDGDGFLEKLGELRAGFQQHLRDERKELLPVIAKVLEAEEASTVAANIEAGIAEAEAAKRAEGKASRDAARQARDAAEAEAEAERAAVRVQKAAERSARAAVDRAAKIVEVEAASSEETVRQIAGTLTAGVAQAATSTKEALGTYRESAQAVTEDLRAVTASSSVSARGLAEAGSAWSEWLSEAARINAEATRRLLGCRTLQQLAEAQRDYGSSVMRNWMATSARVLNVSQQAARQAAKPLDGRLNPNG